jgi:hypothetical protein
MVTPFLSDHSASPCGSGQSLRNIGPVMQGFIAVAGEICPPGIDIGKDAALHEAALVALAGGALAEGSVIYVIYQSVFITGRRDQRQVVTSRTSSIS